MTDETSWPNVIRRHVYELIMLVVTLGLIAAGYVTWNRSSTDQILHLANNYHSASHSHFLKAMEELRQIQNHLSIDLAKPYVSHAMQTQLEGLQTDYNKTVSLHIIRQEVHQGLELQRTFADNRFESLTIKLERLFSTFEKSTIKDVTSEQMIQDVMGLLTPLKQLLRLHSVARHSLLAELENRERRQTRYFFVLLSALLLAGIMIMKRTLVAIDAVTTERKRVEQNLKMLREQAERNENRFKAITNQSSEGITVADPDGNYTLVNAAFCKMIGYSEEELLQMTVFDVKGPEQDTSTFVRSKTSKEGLPIKVLLQRKDGTVFTSEVIGNRIDINGENYVLGTVRDITEQVQADDKLRKSEKNLAIAQQLAHLGSWELDFVTNELSWSDEIFRIYEIDPTILPSYQAYIDGVHPDDREFVTTAYTESVENRTPFDIEHRLLMKDGRVKYVNDRGETSYAEQGKPLSSIGTVLDITERKQAEEIILHQAHFDNLTDLPNRFLSLDRLSQLLTEAQRNDEKVAVLFLDLDDFKKVNDTLGHETGDKLLIETSERLRSVVRSTDTVGRLGGDEFIVLLGGLEDGADARPITENLLKKLKEAFRIDGRELILTASIGIAVFPEDGDNASQMLRNADSAMYHAKKLGRNTYSYFTKAMNLEVSRRLALEEQIHCALDRGEFEVSYQPQFNVSNGRIIGVEALLRWQNPTLGDLSPVEFIPVAEQTGLIVPIGRFVLTEALAQMTQWQHDYNREFRIAVNLSPRQFRDSGLVSFIEKAIHRFGVSGNCLELEITEGVLMSGHGYVDNVLARLNDLGINIAMDDFGTGYSSLSYLRRYPFDVLKIDRSFISDITFDQADRELINAAIALAHGLNLDVVAEGVETKEQLDYLKQRGCDFAQGYFFSKPVSAAAITGMLESDG